MFLAPCVAENFSIAKIIQPLYWQKHAAVSCCYRACLHNIWKRLLALSVVHHPIKSSPDFSSTQIVVSISSAHLLPWSNHPTGNPIQDLLLLTYKALHNQEHTYLTDPLLQWDFTPPHISLLLELCTYTHTKDCTNLRSFKTWTRLN